MGQPLITKVVQFFWDTLLNSLLPYQHQLHNSKVPEVLESHFWASQMDVHPAQGICFGAYVYG